MNNVKRFSVSAMEAEPIYEDTDGEYVLYGDYDALAQQLAASQAELAKCEKKIDEAWNKGNGLEGEFIPGAFDAWKRPVKQHLPYDFSGNPGASATQYCNGWNDAGGYWKNHAEEQQATITRLEATIKKALDLDYQRRQEITKAESILYGENALVNSARWWELRNKFLARHEEKEND